MLYFPRHAGIIDRYLFASFSANAPEASELSVRQLSVESNGSDHRKLVKTDRFPMKLIHRQKATGVLLFSF